MRDPQTFESRVQATYDRWAAEMPTEVDAPAFVRATRPSAVQTRRAWRPARPLLGLIPLSRPVVLVVLTALTLLALVGLLVVAGALRRDPAPVPAAVSNGWIAYATRPGYLDRERNEIPSEIYLVREGVEPRLIAADDAGSARNLCPDFSPDGTWLAYGEGLGPETVGQTLEREQRAIVILTLDGDGSIVGVPTRLPVAGTGLVPCPSWSPDGRQLAYRDGDGDGLVLMQLDGTSTVIPGWHPGNPAEWGSIEWSPDGTMIAVARGSETWLVPVDGAAPRLVASHAFHSVSWSPDGPWIAIYVEGLGARLVSVNGQGGEVDLGPGTGVALWSPAGDRVAYNVASVDDCRIGVARPDGSDPKIVAEGCSYQLATWSPDGRHLLHMRDNIGGGWDLLSTPATGATAATGPIATVTLAHNIPISNTSSAFPGRGDVSWQPVYR